MRIVTVTGTAAEMGEAFGRQCRGGIPKLYAARLSNALAQAELHGGRQVNEDAVLAVARACLEPTRAYDPEGFAELEGIARGSGMSLEQIVAMNGLTDIRDVLSWGGDLEALGGCSAFIVAADWTREGRLVCGQTWDLATDNMPHVLAVHRRPAHGPQTWTLTTDGCLSLIGINEHGVAIGTTNIRTTDARPGVTYLSTIHRALSCATLGSATEAIRAAPRAGAHFFWLADAEGRGLAVETTPELVDEVEVRSGAYVHTNHCLVAAHQAIEADTPVESSRARYDRLEALIQAERGAIDLAAGKRWLGDRANGENALCRLDFNNISSNGSVVVEPQTGTIHACHGPAHDAQWVDLRALSAAS